MDIGCISGSRIPPPHTFNALKLAICKAEQIADPTTCELFGALTDDEPLDEKHKIVLISGEYPGANFSEPAVLVTKQDIAVGKTPVTNHLPKTAGRVVFGQG